jgi:hypothetical protein
MRKLTLVTTHGKNLPLNIALKDRVRGLIDNERCFAVITSVRICFGHEPCRCVRDALKVGTMFSYH